MNESLVVDALAAFRLTRLATKDKITAPLRERVGHAKARELLECQWCMGWWIACGVLAARAIVPRAWDPLARALALSATTGLIAENLD